MFGIGAYAKIKDVRQGTNYQNQPINTYDVKLSISVKNKKTGKYEADFIGWVRFVGKAFNMKPQVGQRIKITNCGTRNCYIKNNKIEFLNNESHTVFDYELVGEQPAQMVADDDLDLPFLDI